MMDLQFDAPKSAWPLQGVGFRVDLDAAEWLATFATPEFGMYTPNPSVAEQLPKMLQGTVDRYRARQVGSAAHLSHNSRQHAASNARSKRGAVVIQLHIFAQVKAHWLRELFFGMKVWFGHDSP